MSLPRLPAAKESLRRTLLVASAIALCAGLAAPAAHAQAYPTRSVRIIVPYGPGTTPDTLARIVGDALSQRLGQTFVVENKTGAGGKIGAEAAAHATPDGYTLLLASKDTQSVIPHLYPSWPVKPDTAFVPIAGVGTIQNVIVTRTAAPWSTLPELMAAARAKEVSYGTPGIGTNLHLMMEYVDAHYGVKALHIPYSRSFAEGFPAVTRGDVDLLVAGLPPMQPMLKDGRIKALAITGAARSKQFPNVPTFSEIGVPGLETGGWFALFAPAGTPAAIVDRLATEMREVLKSPAILAKFEAQAVDALVLTPAELKQLADTESVRWGKVVQSIGVKVE